MKSEEQIRKEIVDLKRRIEILTAHSMTGRERDANAFGLICARERMKAFIYILDDKTK
jgi:hypothetical protein